VSVERGVLLSCRPVELGGDRLPHRELGVQPQRHHHRATTARGHSAESGQSTEVRAAPNRVSMAHHVDDIKQTTDRC
jgi:hypothetical protein